nr:MAG TPA: hypothetical protein [Caudoviricetes sp.]
MAYLEELLPEFRKGAKIRCKSWKAGEYIYVDKKGSVMTEKRNIYILDNVDFTSKYWELYQENIDWDYIIKNKCLCWFWDDENDKNFIATLEAFEIDTCVTSFKSKNGAVWHNCRPVRRDEVTFYEVSDD